MNERHDPIAAARRVSADELARVNGAGIEGAQRAIQSELDLHLWDIRLAAVLNILDIARNHGNHAEWTGEHAAQIRAMMTIADAAVAGSGGEVPQGFGTPVRTRMAEVLMRAKDARDHLAASVEALGKESAAPDMGKDNHDD